MRRSAQSDIVRVFGALLVLSAVCIAVTPSSAFGDTLPPSVPTGLAASPGMAAPVVAELLWSPSVDDHAVAGYYIWRSPGTSGSWQLLGETAGTEYADAAGVPGQAYYYSVSAFDAARNTSARSSIAGPVVAGWPSTSPHLSSGASGGESCALCHVPHVAASTTGLMRPTGEAPGELAVCYACHDGQGGPNVKTAMDNSFALPSGHSLEDSGTAGDLTDRCSGCHTAHKAPTFRPSLPAESVNAVPITKADNTWCLACHNDAADWYAGTYPAVSSPSRDASGYPVAGMFPGAAVYADPARNAHASIPASGTVRQSGDCLYCHASHRAANKYDGLLKRFAPTTTDTLAEDQSTGAYAESCFDCHGGALRSEFTTLPVDIRQFVTAGKPRSGHRIKTAGGTLPAGSPLPCYDCHNPHGSSRNNASLISDALGQDLDTASAVSVRAFCLSCHSSSNGFVWNSPTSTYLAVGSQTVEGLRRDGSDGSLLHLPVVTGHSSGDTHSCYQCHGSSYAVGGSNVHNPTGGISDGGVPCYDCHSEYMDHMEDGLGAKTGAQRNLTYHHVLGGSFNNGAYRDGDVAPGPAGTYPTSGVSNLFCTVCHVDHDQFNAQQAANLRAQYPSYSSGTATNTDFSASLLMGGVCTSCHGLPMVKDTTDQLSDGTAVTQPVNAGRYASSAHRYTVESRFGDSSSFRAECSKCHNDEQPKEFQGGGVGFGTHWSASGRLLSALGATVSDSLQESHCYRCHARAGDVTGGTTKSVAGRDYYDAAVMSGASERVWAQFQLASKHPVVASGGDSVECESCHNVHVVSSAAPVTDPDNTLNSLSYTTIAQQATFCLRCHDSGAPAYISNGSTYVPSTVTLTGAENNKATNAARAHWTANGSITAPQSCATCHDNHGSEYPRLLGAYDMVAGRNRILGQNIDGNDNSVCRACHNAADAAYPAFARDSVGYPVDGTWPGLSVYADATNGIHSGTGAMVWPGSSYVGGDCKNCHDVHGTSNIYDELRGSFSQSNFGTCFTCHAADGPATSDVATYYPLAAGGTKSDSLVRYGHKTVEAGTLPAGSALPCYDCHNPHGSASATGLLVVTQTSSTATIAVGDVAGELSLSTGPGVRQFCLTCHVPSNTSNGWNGSTYAAVSAGARVEGLDRLTQLKLSARTPHQQANTNSCLVSTCHIDPHYPQ